MALTIALAKPENCENCQETEHRRFASEQYLPARSNRERQAWGRQPLQRRGLPLLSACAPNLRLAVKEWMKVGSKDV